MASRNLILVCLAVLLLTSITCGADKKSSRAAPPQAPFTDYRYEKPGTVRKITAKDLPAPFATKSAVNGPNLVDRPPNMVPIAPAGFKVELFAEKLNEPRKLLTAPNGDIFLAESRGGDIRVYRGIGTDGKPQQNVVYATGLSQPYGIAFYPPGPNPQYVYIGDTDAVVRFAYRNGDLKATGQPEKIADLPAGGSHWTRDLVFSQDGKQLFVGVGSDSNVNDPDTSPGEKRRAQILVMDPDGKNQRTYASGIRNAGRRTGGESQDG